ncbi:MAG: type II toxin-antitoxin system VapC family toxin [Candidatus Binatia bacterium]
MKVLFDTNIYLEAARSEEARERFHKSYLPLLPFTVLSAVVAYELRVDARDEHTRELVKQYVAPMERAGRIASPTFADWTEAANVVTSIETRDKQWRSKLPALLNDVLIALCARRVGATVFTHNRADFQLIRRHGDFALRVV